MSIFLTLVNVNIQTHTVREVDLFLTLGSRPPVPPAPLQLLITVLLFLLLSLLLRFCYPLSWFMCSFLLCPPPYLLPLPVSHDPRSSSYQSHVSYCPYGLSTIICLGFVYFFLLCAPSYPRPLPVSLDARCLSFFSHYCVLLSLRFSR